MDSVKPEIRPISSLKISDTINVSFNGTIKARVVGKSCTERYFYDSGGCKHTWFTMGLCDNSGEIRASAFDESCQEFYDAFQVDKVYYIRGGSVKPAKKEQNNMKNVYDLQLNEDTQVEECEDTKLFKLPKIKFNFMPLQKIYKLDLGTYVDVIGVCISDSGIIGTKSKIDDTPLILREITLLDSTRRTIPLVLWETDAEVFNSKGNPVVAIKGAGVSQYQGRRKLRCPLGVIMEPAITEAEILRTWFKEDYIPSILIDFPVKRYIDEEEESDDYE